MTKPLVTCLMTVYNGMPYLPETVRTMLAQTFSDFRFIIIDNESSDGTAEYLAGITDARVTLGFAPRSVSRTRALNQGLESIDTEFTAIIDADDLAAPRRLERQAAFLQKRPDVALVGSDVYYINRQSEPVGADRFPTEHAELVRRLPVSNQFAHSACMLRTSAVKDVGGYPEEYLYAQDMGLWMALLHKGHKVASLPEYLTSIRIHPAQTSRDAAWYERRMQDELKLDQAMIDLPEMSAWSRQVARLRLGMTLRRLGREDEAKAELRRCFKEAPFFFLNPLLWRRAFLSLKRRVFPLKAS